MYNSASTGENANLENFNNEEKGGLYVRTDGFEEKCADHFGWAAV